MTPTRILGRTGVQVSPLGFGVSGPHASPVLTRQATIDLVREAIDLGVTLYDTGPAYGNGEAEIRLGQALAGLQADDLFVTTKAGVVAGKPGRPIRDFSSTGIVTSLDNSLRRLDLEQVGALFLHGPHSTDITDELLETLVTLQNTGKVRFLGICGRGDELEYALTSPVFDIMMAPCHTNLDPDLEDHLNRAKQVNLGVIGIEAMAGANSGWRWPRSAGDAWYLARAVKQSLVGTRTAPSRLSPPAAMQSALERKTVDCVLSLTTRREHLIDNVRMTGLDPDSHEP